MLFSICLCSRCCKGNNCFIPVSCPCLSIFVLVFYVVLVSSYRLCCLPFPSCSVFFVGGWCSFFDGWLCLCLCSIAHFLLCFLPFGCLLFVLPSFLSLCGFSFLSEFVVFCLLSLTVCLWLLLWSLLLVFPSFVVVHNFFCLGFCHFVCVYDGVFWWVADFNCKVNPNPNKQNHSPISHNPFSYKIKI